MDISLPELDSNSSGTDESDSESESDITDSSDDKVSDSSSELSDPLGSASPVSEEIKYMSEEEKDRPDSARG